MQAQQHRPAVDLELKLAQEIGGRIAVLRERAGISQVKLSELSGLSRPQIARLETARRRVSAEQLYRIAVALKCEPTAFMPTIPELAELSEV